MKQCSAEGCKGKPIKKVWCLGYSHFTKRHYKMLLDLCQIHYDNEKKMESIIDEVKT